MSQVTNLCFLSFGHFSSLHVLYFLNHIPRTPCSKCWWYINSYMDSSSEILRNARIHLQVWAQWAWVMTLDSLWRSRLSTVPVNRHLNFLFARFPWWPSLLCPTHRWLPCLTPTGRHLRFRLREYYRYVTLSNNVTYLVIAAHDWLAARYVTTFECVTYPCSEVWLFSEYFTGMLLSHIVIFPLWVIIKGQSWTYRIVQMILSMT